MAATVELVKDAPRRRPSLRIVILSLWLVSVAVRFAIYDSRTNIVDLDATYHVLLTVQAYRETPASVHHFWPLVSLGSAPERGVPFGTTVPDANGLYYYMSFPPAGFIAPYLFFQITRLPLTPTSLMLFNLGIHLAATILMCLLVRDALRAFGKSDEEAYGPVIFAGATYLFSTEALLSHGLIYWHHSLFQVVWLGQLRLFFSLLRKRETAAPLPRWFTAAFIGLAFLAPSVEWAGYIANVAIAGWLLWSERKLAVGVLAATFAAGMAFLVHVTSVVGLVQLAESLRYSIDLRGHANGSVTDVLRGYIHSYFLLPIFALLAPLIVRARRAGGLGLSKPLVALLIVGAMPLVENFLLPQHATQYSFDLLKALIPICLLSAIALSVATGATRRVLAVAWAALLVVNVVYRPSRTRDLTVAIDHDTAILGALEKVTKPCTLFAVNSFARGWVYLTLHHNVVENVVSMDSLRALTARHNACQGVMLVGDDAGNQIYDWTGALVFDPPDRVRTFAVPPAAR